MGLQIYELFFIYQQKTCFSALWVVDNSCLSPSRHLIQVRPARHAYLLVTIGPLVTPDLIRLLVMPDSISPLVMSDRAPPPADTETESATTVSETDRQSLGHFSA